MKKTPCCYCPDCGQAMRKEKQGPEYPLEFVVYACYSCKHVYHVPANIFGIEDTKVIGCNIYSL